MWRYSILIKIKALYTKYNPKYPFFHQDWAPTHYKIIVRGALIVKFPSRWIGRGGVTAWPPRNLDITPCALVWRYVNKMVCSHKVWNLAHLREIIRYSVSIATREMSHVWAEIVYYSATVVRFILAHCGSVRLHIHRHILYCVSQTLRKRVQYVTADIFSSTKPFLECLISKRFGDSRRNAARREPDAIGRSV